MHEKPPQLARADFEGSTGVLILFTANLFEHRLEGLNKNKQIKL